MSDQYAISAANLSRIENNLETIYHNINTLSSNINQVDNNVRVVYDELGKLAKDFHDYVETAGRQHNVSVAETRLVKIRQEIERKFGHYSEVRRTTTGILQADDLGIVKKDTITNVTEELMLSAPNYWLAPCLVALAAWINDQPELAERALNEGIRRNDEKTSLLFALICRRAGRKDACLKWTQRYLANQDEENLDRKCIVILDAFASGLLGADSDGVISKQMGKWMDHLAEKAGFVEQQTAQWSEAIKLKIQPLKDNEYTYLSQYSKTWPQLKEVLEGANLHAVIFKYFEDIFEKEASTEPLKVQLDEILSSLVTDFDDEELPMRRDEKLNQFIIDFAGDTQRAQANMNVEQTAFETHKDFTQLLTDAAMKPESSHASPSTQKFSIALSRDWISNAYNDVTAENRMKVPNEIEINVDTYNGKTTDGQNEEALVQEFINLVNWEEQNALSALVLSAFDKFLLPGGAAVAVLGLIMLVGGLLGVVILIAGAGMIISHFSKKKNIEARRSMVMAQFAEKREKGAQIIRATLAEVVDFRREFKTKDSESQKVTDFLDQITPDQYVRNLDTTRRIKVSE